MIAEALTCDEKRSVWDNSPELRAAVRSDLEEWGRAQRGGLPNLGFPDHEPYATPPERDPVDPHNADKVDLITHTLTLWMLQQRRITDIDLRAEVLRLILTLRFHFISDRPVEAKAKAMGTSRATFWRRIDEATFRFWVMHY